MKKIENLPLVTIIVRTKNRPMLLVEALQSIAKQTYPKIEIIVVNDGGSDVSEIVERLKNNIIAKQLIQLPKSKGRSGAANEGLKRAAGIWIGFLDDDDLLEPIHIKQLIKSTLLNDAKLVYSGTNVLQVNPDGSTNAITEYNVPYLSERLLYENFIPIHSVLLHRGLIDNGVCFDTSFDFFEDWDFLLQISQKTKFLHSPLVTAIYRLHSNASGVHQQSNKISPYLHIYRKWLSDSPIEIIFSLLQKSHQWHEDTIAALQDSHGRKLEEIGQKHSYAQQIVQERDKQLADLKQALEKIGQIVQERDKQLAECDTYIRKLLHSKSWFITKPIRWVGRIVRGDFIAAMNPIKKMLHLNNLPALSLQIATDLEPPKNSDSFVMLSPIKPTHPVAVILPVYSNVEMTKNCILAAIPSILTIPDARIIAINDDSPDKGMQDMLEQLATQWPDVFVVLRNEKNQGFVGTVNRGFAYFPHHDAMLLNSDVIVPKNWLGRLIDEAYSKANIGTVTPFSNNATLCSFPHFLEENVQPFNLDVDFIDAVFRQVKLPCVEAPTGVGFCMYIRRSCLDEIGLLNEEKFGRGYGEENDLCQRALKAGWLNIISPNIYAYHEGGISFSSEKKSLIDNAMRVIDSLHPNYHADIQTFIKNDPVKSVRVARYIQLLSAIPIPKVLHVSHALGGGVAQHVDELCKHFGQSIAHILLAPYVGENTISISLGADQHADKLLFAIPSGYADMLGLLEAIGLSAIHFHHTQGLDPIFLRLPSDLCVTHLLTVHDYYWLNGNPTLTDKQGKYPGFYSDTLHNPLYPLPPGLTTAAWQEQLRPLVENAECVIFPSNSTKSFFDNVYQLKNAVVAPHVEALLTVGKKPHAFIKKDGYIIGVLGAIGREKGADVLEEIAGKAKSQGLPFKFKLIGYAYRSLKVVETTGPYKTKELTKLIQKHKLDIVFFSAQWPETYSYTLSYALDSGLPIIAPNIGAFCERLSGRANTLLFNHLDSVHVLLKQIEAFIDKLAKGVTVMAPFFEGDQSYPDFYTSNYMPIVSRDLKVIASDKTAPFMVHSAQIVSGLTGDKNTLREFLLRVLWSLYMNPSMRWINHAIPYAVSRCVKRSLSRSAIHDITNYK